MKQKNVRMGLIPKLIIAILLGIFFGSFLPEWFNRLVVTPRRSSAPFCPLSFR